MAERHTAGDEQRRLVDDDRLGHVQDGVETDLDVELSARARHGRLDVLELQDLAVLQLHPASLVAIGVDDLEHRRRAVEERLAEAWCEQKTQKKCLWI